MVDSWDAVSARRRALSYHRDYFLPLMDKKHNPNKREREKGAEKREKPRHSVPGRGRLVQQEGTQESVEVKHSVTEEEDEDEDVQIDDEPSKEKEKIVLPHKKRKLSVANNETAAPEKRYSL